MEEITGECIGNIDVIVYENENGEKFFKLQANTEETSPILDVLEERLSNY